MNGKALGAEISNEVLRFPVEHGQFGTALIVHVLGETVLRKGMTLMEWVLPPLAIAPVPFVHPLLVKAIPMAHLALPRTQL